MNVERGGLAQSVQVRIVRRATEIGVDPNLLLTRYGLERLLYRLSRSPHAERFVLKGAMLLLAWLGETLRPTRDVDLLGYGEMSDATLKRMIQDVCTVDADPDGMTFLPQSVDVEPIREEDVYGGRRVTLQAQLGPARIKVQLDIGIGDAVVPAPQWLDYPSLLGLPCPRVRAYPREAVLAEKLHAMVLLGMRNSRMKDYFDVHALLREGAMDRVRIAHAVAATFERRRTEVPEHLPIGLSDTFADDATHQTRWHAFLARNRLQGPSLPDLVREIRDGLGAAFADARRPGSA